MRLPSVMKHNFSHVPKANIQRSTFNRSSGLKTTLNGDELAPIFVDEALPGDTFNLKASHFARLATPLRPIMDNMYFETFYFAVPLRLVWNNFQKFMGEQTDPGDSTDYLIPQVVSPATTGWTYKGIADHLGIPTEIPGLSHSALFHRAYHLIWNEWFRDQNLQDSLVIDKGDGPDTKWTGYDGLRNRNKKHDYFTSALPWPQKGPAINIPIGTSAPVETTGDLMVLRGATSDVQVNMVWSNTIGFTGAGGSLFNGESMEFGDTTGLYADLDAGVLGTINELRQAFQLQKLLERDARGGTRYTEIIRAHFGVISPDARLQRPEFLGSSSHPININPIAQTSETSVDSPQGNLAAMGTTAGVGSGFIKSFTEHTIILGLANIRADLNYQQGLDRMFSRQTKYDFYWPALAHIGEQAILLKEIYAQGTVDDDDVFGYQERYAEYRYKPSKVTAAFRSNYAQTLDSWHLAENFATAPQLNPLWIQSSTPWSRVIAVTQDVLLLDMYFDLKCTRPMPAYSVPGLVDHF